MTIVRCAAGLAAVISAMLLQATVVGPLLYPVPVSLPLLVVVGVAVLCGPSTGIALGFGAGLLADLTANHPVGLLALIWLGAGVVGGVVGGLVEAHRPAAPRTGPFRGARGRGRSAAWSRAVRATRERRKANSFGPSQWRAQAMLTGVVTAAATAAGLILVAAVGGTVGLLPAQLVQIIPATLIDAMLAVAVLALARAMVASAALRPVIPARMTGATTRGGPTPDRPMEFV